MAERIYRYIGDGGYIVGVPARDLSEDEVRALGLDERMLVASGLYRVVVRRERDEEKKQEE